MINNFEEHLNNVLETLQDSTLKESMAYSLLNGGKRVRPRLLFALLQDLNVEMETGIEPSLALEMIHTYSLVHDDLPAMDNDEMRRHKPTNHIVYGEGMAILAGDGLLTEAFNVITNSNLNSKIRIECVRILAQNAGPNGMILGQELDTVDQIDSIEQLDRCYELKTGCLFAASLEMAVTISGHFDLQDIARNLGLTLGKVFQYQDDILEFTSTPDDIGKSSTSDLERGKTTVVSLLGLEKAQERTNYLFDEISDLLSQMPLQDNQLESLINTITRRTF